MSIALFACNALIVAGYHAFLSIPHHYSIWSAGDLIGKRALQLGSSSASNRC